MVKVGSVIKIKESLIEYEYYGANNIDRDMIKYSGRIGTVTYITRNLVRNGYHFHIDIDLGRWWWTEEMCESKLTPDLFYEGLMEELV